MLSPLIWHMNKKIICFAALTGAALLLSSCKPLEILNNILDDVKPENAALTSAVKEHRQSLTGYGYNALKTEAERNAYATVGYLAQRGEDTVFMLDNDGTPAKMGDIIDLYKGDHPEVFWLDDSGGYEYTKHDTYTEIRLLYTFTGEDLIEARKQFSDRVEEILEEAPKDKSKYEKELWLNDMLVENCEYDEEAAEENEVVSNEQNSYGALVDGKVVCEGYTRAFQLLCSKMDIPCVSVNGTAENAAAGGDGNHIWNAVQLDDEWYYVDVTWNDFQPNSDEYQLTEIEKHLYFNITTDKLLEDHKISPLYGSEEETDYYNAFIPECTAKEYNFFHKSLITISSAKDSGKLQKALTKAAADNAESFAFCIDEDADYEEVVDDIINGNAYSWIKKANEKNDDKHQLSYNSKFFTYEEINAAAFVLEYE